jgi:UDP-N-acetylglucosamine 2-epimerase
MDNFEFLKLKANTQLVINDLEGIKEVTCKLKLPCMNLIENTERPKTAEE